MSEQVTLKGQTFNLEGVLVKPGDSAPDCELIGTDLQSKKLSSFKGKPILLMSVPSLDTDVCSREAKRFNEEVGRFGENLLTICVSQDLPFALSRFCGREDIKNIQTLSDYKNREFGKKYGVLISELGLLARAVFLIDTKMKLSFVHLVKEVSEEPDYKTILKHIDEMMSHI